MNQTQLVAAIGALLFASSTAWGGPPSSPRVEQVSPPILPTPLASFGAVRDGDWLYLYSGHQGPTHHHSFDNLSPVFGRLSLHDMKTWELFELPVRTQSAALVAHQGRIIRIGGLTAKNRAGEEDDLDSLASVQAFDPLTCTWSDLPDLPQPRSSHDARPGGIHRSRPHFPARVFSH